MRGTIVKWIREQVQNNEPIVTHTKTHFQLKEDINLLKKVKQYWNTLDIKEKTRLRMES